MFKKQPIILCAFANDLERPLKLVDEEKAIDAILKTVHDTNRIEFKGLHGTTLDDIYKNFNRFHNRVHIFHFAGHSNGTFLQLEDTKARAASLSVLMGIQKNLKLVFLNGCSNKKQVEELAKKGVKAVIATSAAVDDQRSIEFAKAFYDALAGGGTIKESFDIAKSKIQNDADIEVVHRGLDLSGMQDDMPWGLYANDEADLDWKLPDPFEVPEDLDTSLPVFLNDPNINKVLVEETFKGLIPLKSSYRRLWEEYLDTEEETTLLELQDKIYKVFPSLLSIQIRDLFTPEAKQNGRLRLVELNEVYLILSKLLCSIALSDLWRILLCEDENSLQLVPQEDILIRRAYKEELEAFAQIKHEQANAYNYFWLLSTIYRIFEDNDHQPFLSEMNHLYQVLLLPELFDAYHFMEYDLKERCLAGNIASQEVLTLCKAAEKHLGVLLSHCAFLTNYQLISINDIQVSKSPIAIQADFIHKKAILRGHESTLWNRDPQARKTYTCNHAIIITHNIKQETEPLTLAPFMIDENVLKKDSNKDPKVHFWAGQKGENRLNYQHAEVLTGSLEIPPQRQLDKYRPDGLAQITTLWTTFREHIKNLATDE